MKKIWFDCRFLVVLMLLFTACSDNNDPIPDPDPDPTPTPELKVGINLSPETLNADQEVTITFKAGASSGLYNYDGDVYVHIGVVEGNNWMYVPADWNENIAKCKMTKVEANVWSITLSPNIRQWFGVASGTPVQKIGIVFRNTDGSKKGIESDSFIAVTDDTFQPGETTKASQPAGTVDGINVINNSTVTLVMYDKDKNGKSKDYAYVIGDFNDWKIDNAYQMKRDETTGCWWITIDGLNAQTEYAFQYFVGTKADGNIRLADAYTEKVLDPQDHYIPASTYPGLRPYPADKTAGIVSTFKIEPDTYNWEVDNFEQPDRDNLIIYELLLRDFTTSGDINGALMKLDYLQALGVNAIELMPVQEFDGNDSWGYNPAFYFAMDKAYGTKAMYKELIDECHKRGMAVILDVVYNHATGANPFAQLYWNASVNKTAANNPWFNVDAPHPYSVFHDFNHESPLVKTFVNRNLKFLIDEYRIDGFRFDLTKGFTQNKSTESTASNYDASRIAILKGYNDAIRAAKPDAIVILEHFAVEREEKELANAGMQLWRNLNEAYRQTAMGWQEKSAFTALTTKDTTMPFGGWVGYMESHDEERMGYVQTQWGNGALKTDLATRMRQLAANASMSLTVPGPKMIWQFGEMGYDVSIDYNGRTGRKPVRWEDLDDTHRKGLHDAYQKLIALRMDVPELFSSISTFEWNVKESDWNNGRTISLRANNGKGLVVLANFTNASVNSTVMFPSTGTWYNYIDRTERIVNSSQQNIAVPANSYLVYVNF